MTPTKRKNVQAICVKDKLSIGEVYKLLGRSKELNAPFGIVVIVDEKEKVIGVVTDGDIRRAFANDIPFDHPADEIMVRDPLYVSDNMNLTEMKRSIYRQARASGRLSHEYKADKVLVLDDEKRLKDIVNFFALSMQTDPILQRIAVIGLGQVGLPLSLLLAESGFMVSGYDINSSLVDGYIGGKVPFHEPGVEEKLQFLIKEDNLSFVHELSETEHEVYIIAVGTAVTDKHQPDLEDLTNCIRHVGGLLKQGDLVVIRSTIPVGTTRNVLIPILDQMSRLKAGTDYHVVFAPERVSEGIVLRELRSLPQIVGGLTERCSEKAIGLFNVFVSTCIKVDSLEAAEIVKLANNTFRDLSFAFANELSLICAEYNIDAFHVIQSANEGYPRNPISLPSPGVGGYCLSKDPYIYSSLPVENPFHEPVLGKAARKVNERMISYVLNMILRFSARENLDLGDIKVFIAGFAFKGHPETSDIRDSVAVKILRQLQAKGCQSLAGYDAVVPKEILQDLGVRPVSLSQGFEGANVVLFLNNHPDNEKFDLFTNLHSMASSAMFFDGWHQFDREAFSKIPGVSYATIGYESGGDIASWDSVYLAVVEDVKREALSQEGMRWQIRLPERKKITTLTSMHAINHHRKESLEDSLRKEVSPLYFGSGGATMIINDQWLLAVERSSDAPTYPGHLSTLSGRSRGWQDIIDPFQAWREFFEEFLMADSSGTLLIPHVEDPPFSSGDNEKIHAIVKKGGHIIHRSFAGEKEISLAYDQDRHPDEIEVYWGERLMKRIHAFVHYNEELSETNVLLLFTCQLDLDETIFLDVETAVRHAMRIAIKRRLALIDIKDKQSVIFIEDGKQQAPEKLSRHQVTPHLKYLMDKAGRA